MANGVPATNDKDWIFDKALPPFLGVGAAFLLNVLYQRRVRRAEEHAAGALALFSLKALFKEFVTFRRFFQRHLAAQIAKYPGIPIWMCEQPSAFKFTDGQLFDFKSLSFLLTSKNGMAAFEALQVISETHFDLKAWYEALNESAIDYQRTIHDALPSKHGHTVAEIEASIPGDLKGRLGTQQQAVAVRVHQNEARYRKAYKRLRDSLVDEFSDAVKFGELEILDKFKEANLPPLPHELLAYIESVPPDQALQ
jgi:hypothetical protein